MPTRILVLAANKTSGDALTQAIEPVKLEMDTFVGADRPTFMENYRLVVMEVGPELPNPGPMIERLAPSAHVVLILPSLTIKEIITRASNPRVSHLLAAPLDNKQLVHLRFLAHKLASGDIFGIERYLETEWEMGYRRVTTAEERTRAVTRLLAFVKRDRDRGYLDRVSRAAERLLFQAMYASPVDDEGKRIFGDTSLEACMQRDAPSSVSMRYAQRGSHLFLAVRDRYGSLNREALLASLASIDDKRAESGIRLATSEASRVMLNLLPDQVLEVICTYEQSAKGLRMFSLTSHRDRSATPQEPPPRTDKSTDMFFAVPSDFFTG